VTPRAIVGKTESVAKKILFVDDDKLVTRIYCEKLKEDGFEVVSAEDGVQAMKKLVEFKPELVVLDLLMPKLNGADVLKFIRQNADLKSTHVIVFSNSFLAALVEQVGALGVDGVMPKSSATPTSLIGLIRRVLSGTQPTAAPAPKPAPSKPAETAIAPPPPAQTSPAVSSPVETSPAVERTAEKKAEQ
jgi:CheY-like chemotaxis protein